VVSYSWTLQVPRMHSSVRNSHSDRFEVSRFDSVVSKVEHAPEVPVGDTFTRVVAILRTVAVDRSQHRPDSDIRKARWFDDRQTITISTLMRLLTFIGVRSHPTRPPNRRLASRLRAPCSSIVEDGDGYQPNFYPTFYPTTRDPVPSGCFHR